MPGRSDARAGRSIARGLPWLAVILAVGCAPVARNAGTAGAPAAATPETVPKPPAAAASVEVDPDAGGFTVAQAVVLAPEVRADYDDAVRLIEDGRLTPGIALLLAVVERAPDAAAAHLALGIAYQRSSDLDLAAASLSRALELAPGHPAVLNELGRVRRRQGRFEESRASYEAALVAFGEFHHAHRNLAILCDLYLGDTACALEHYEAYSRIVPDDTEVVKWIADLRNRASVEATR